MQTPLKITAAIPAIAKEVRGDDQHFLRSSEHGARVMSQTTIAVVDLFSGCGGMSLGVREAIESLGLTFKSKLAVDFDSDAGATYAANFQPDIFQNSTMEEVLDGGGDAALTTAERGLRKMLGPIDLLIGGPPCQGHSDLNNFARRGDPKNAHYFRMARAAEVFEPEAIIIENVVGAAHDSLQVVQRTQSRLEELGYNTSLGTIDCSAIGVPQTRRRLLLLASRRATPTPKAIESAFTLPKRNVKWAIGDLNDFHSEAILDKSANSAAGTRTRIDYLFTHDLYELPNSERPPCHRDKKHSYNSIYGRLRWDQPAQTITSGFYSMCMGRYVHPDQKRTLTAHEAARLQFFPDFFDFSPVSNRTSLARIIGNAVPVKLAYVATLGLLVPNAIIDASAQSDF